MAVANLITPTDQGGSATLSVPAGSVYTLGLYVTSGQVPLGARAVVSWTSPGKPTEVLELSGATRELRVRQVSGPADYTITLFPGQTVGVGKNES
jgi:hypothetical protein